MLGNVWVFVQLIFDFWSSLAYESAEQKPQHCLTPGFLNNSLASRVEDFERNHPFESVIQPLEHSAPRKGSTQEPSW